MAGEFRLESGFPGEFAADPIGVAPHLRSCIAVVDEPTLLNLEERWAVPIARYFVSVKSALVVLLAGRNWKTNRFWRCARNRAVTV